MERASLQDLLRRYETLLELYTRLGDISGEICRLLEAGSDTTALVPMLRESAGLADRIHGESMTLASMKEALVGRDLLSETERILVRKSERSLAETVSRVMEHENRSREIILKRGVKISRR